jgi:hypothetical protein
MDGSQDASPADRGQRKLPKRNSGGGVAMQRIE